jgi:hypothetical protein
MLHLRLVSLANLRSRPTSDECAAIRADEGAFIIDNQMAGYGAKRTPERPTDIDVNDGLWPS